MKIGFVFDDTLDKPDGVQQYIFTLGAWLRGQGHDVHFLVGQTKRTDIPNIHSLSRNVSVRFNHNKLSIPLPVSRKKLKTFLAEQEFDVLHVQMPYSPYFAGRVVLTAPTKTAIVGTFHIMPYGLASKFGTKLLNILSRKSLKRFDQVVAVSDAAQHFAKTGMGLETVVVPNAVDLDRFKVGQGLAEFADGKHNLVFLGRLVPRKGTAELLKAVNLLNQQKRFENRRLIIVGSGPEEPKLKSYVNKHNMTDKIIFTGQAEESQKANYFASAELAVLPSLSGESFGIVVVEAIASGAGVVLGGDNPGYRFVLADSTEALVNPSQTKVFADKIDQLLKDVNLRAQINAAQKQRIRQFDIKVIGPRIEEIYSQAIDKNKHDKL